MSCFCISEINPLSVASFANIFSYSEGCLLVCGFLCCAKGFKLHSVQFSSVAQSCLTLCNPMNRSMPGLPVHHHLPEFTQTHVHRISDAKHLLMCLLATCMSSLEKYLFRSSAYLQIVAFFFFLGIELHELFGYFGG